MKVAYVLGFLPPLVRREIGEMCRSGVEVTVWLPSGDPLWDSITGGDLPEGARRGGRMRDLLVDTRSPGEIMSLAASLCRRLVRDPAKVSGSVRSAVEAGSPAFLAFGSRLADAMSADPPDRIHAHFAWEPAFVAMWAARLLGIPFSVTVHARDIFVPRCEGTLRLLLREASPVFATSEHLRGSMAARWGDATAARTVLSRIGIDPDELPVGSPGGRRGDLVWCTASGLVEKKGVPVLLEACEILAAAGRRFRCVVAGSDGSGETLERFRSFVAARGLSGTVELPGALPLRENLEGMSRCAVLAMPSVRAQDGDMDGIPTVLVEAMCMGTPVVSTRLSGIPELVEDGVSGILTEPGDAAALASALALVMDDRVRASELGEAGRHRVRGEFTVERQAGRMLDAWRKASEAGSDRNGEGA